jgi:hypothetical protein
MMPVSFKWDVIPFEFPNNITSDAVVSAHPIPKGRADSLTQVNFFIAVLFFVTYPYSQVVLSFTILTPP